MEEKLRVLMAEVLGLPASNVGPDADVDSLDEWDSLRHMNLIFAIEDAFSVRFEDNELADLTSVPRILASLRRKLPQA